MVNFAPATQCYGSSPVMICIELSRNCKGSSRIVVQCNPLTTQGKFFFQNNGTQLLFVTLSSSWVIYIFSITVTPHDRRQTTGSVFNNVYKRTTQKYQREIPWIPLTKGNDAKSVSMSWRHHVSPLVMNQCYLCRSLSFSRHHPTHYMSQMWPVTDLSRDLLIIFINALWYKNACFNGILIFCRQLTSREP